MSGLSWYLPLVSGSFPGDLSQIRLNTVVTPGLWKLKILSLIPSESQILFDCSIGSFPKLSSLGNIAREIQAVGILLGMWAFGICLGKNNSFTEYLLVVQNWNFLIGPLHLIIEKFTVRHCICHVLCVCVHEERILFQEQCGDSQDLVGLLLSIWFKRLLLELKGWDGDPGGKCKPNWKLS